MSSYKIFFFTFFLWAAMPLGYSNFSPCSDYSTTVNTPVEKIKPKEKKQKRLEEKLQKKIWKQEQTKAKQGLKRPALIFWFTVVIITMSLVILCAFLIGLGIIPWSIALYLMLGADVAAITILASILLIDVPDFPDVMAFVVSLISWAVMNFVIGLAFLIWGLAISWVFGWMIGLILLGLAIIFLAIYFIAAGIAAKKE